MLGSNRLNGHHLDFHRYPGTGHWFAEADRPAAYVEDAAETAWARTIAFLTDRLGVEPGPQQGTDAGSPP